MSAKERLRGQGLVFQEDLEDRLKKFKEETEKEDDEDNGGQEPQPQKPKTEDTPTTEISECQMEKMRESIAKEVIDHFSEDCKNPKCAIHKVKELLIMEGYQRGLSDAPKVAEILKVGNELSEYIKASRRKR